MSTPQQYDPATEPPPAEAASSSLSTQEPPVVPDEEATRLSEGAAVSSTRAARLWITISAAIVLLVVVLVFILENLKSTKVSFFSLHWKIPLAIDLLFAAVLGGLLVFFAGAVRILQLRRVARRHHHALRRMTDQLAEPGPGD